MEQNNEQPGLRFNELLKALRKSRGKKHREIADAIGLATSSYSNSEAQPYKRMSVDKVHKLCTYYGLNDVQKMDMIQRWEAQPVSPFREKQLDYWKKRNEVRRKVRDYDRSILVIAELIGVVMGAVPDPGALCICEPPDLFSGEPVVAEVVPCELCAALQFVGLPGWTTADDVRDRLSQVEQEANERIAAKKAAK